MKTYWLLNQRNSIIAAKFSKKHNTQYNVVIPQSTIAIGADGDACVVEEKAIGNPITKRFINSLSPRDRDHLVSIMAQFFHDLHGAKAGPSDYPKERSSMVAQHQGRFVPSQWVSMQLSKIHERDTFLKVPTHGDAHGENMRWNPEAGIFSIFDNSEALKWYPARDYASMLRHEDENLRFPVGFVGDLLDIYNYMDRFRHTGTVDVDWLRCSASTIQMVKSIKRAKAAPKRFMADMSCFAYDWGRWGAKALLPRARAGKTPIVCPDFSKGPR